MVIPLDLRKVQVTNTKNKHFFAIVHEKRRGGKEMTVRPYQDRIKRCSQLMKAQGLDALLLTKPSNMFYLTGDGRLCAYAMITQDGKVALGVPQTDVEDVKNFAHYDHIVGFDDEVGMIHSIAHQL